MTSSLLKNIMQHFTWWCVLENQLGQTANKATRQLEWRSFECVDGKRHTDLRPIVKHQQRAICTATKAEMRDLHTGGQERGGLESNKRQNKSVITKKKNLTWSVEWCAKHQNSQRFEYMGNKKLHISPESTQISPLLVKWKTRAAGLITREHISCLVHDEMKPTETVKG